MSNTNNRSSVVGSSVVQTNVTTDDTPIQRSELSSETKFDARRDQSQLPVTPELHNSKGGGSSIEVYGARENNLKNIDATLPHGSLTVITGLSGSGKSSLAFDTLFAEGQRRYIETFSAYARNFLGGMQRPEVDKVTGLSPVISIEQKTTNKNPRSTVGTITEVYDYLRLLYARAGEAYSYESGERMVKYTEEQIIELILNEYKGKRIFILAPLVKARKGHYRELFEQVRRKGFLYVRVDGEVMEVTHGMRLDRYKNHDIEVVVDKLKVDDKDDRRLRESVANAMVQGDGLIMVLDKECDEVRHYSKRLMCPVTGLAYKEPAPHNFSFNSPQGACPKCKGLGHVTQLDIDKLIPDKSLSIYKGAIVPLGNYKNTLIFREIEALLARYEYTLKTPVEEMEESVIKEIFYGSTAEVDRAVLGHYGVSRVSWRATQQGGFALPHPGQEHSRAGDDGHQRTV